jgi:hypothetical protein
MITIQLPLWLLNVFAVIFVVNLALSIVDLYSKHKHYKMSILKEKEND